MDSPKPRLLLVEDQNELQKTYLKTLTYSGFSPELAEDLSSLENKLKQNQNNPFEVILSDTELPDGYAYETIEKLLNQNLISQNTLILGMSEDHKNEEKWGGIAHFKGFFEKHCYLPFSENKKTLGPIIWSHYYNFKYNITCSDIWHSRMFKKNTEDY